MSLALISSELLRVRSRRMAFWMMIGFLAVLALVFAINVIDPPRGSQYRMVNGVPIFTESALVFDGERALRTVFNFLPLLLGGSVLLGSSVVGAEWATRGLTNVLIWEPRRIHLLSAKLVALGMVVGAAVLAYIALVVAAFALATLIAGGTVTDLELTSVGLAAIRASLFSVVVAMLGATTAAVMRSTVASFAVAFLLLAIIQPIIMGWNPEFARWLFTTNAITFLAWRDVGFELTRSGPVQAGLVLAVYSGAFIGISMAVFRKQEIG